MFKLIDDTIISTDNKGVEIKVVPIENRIRGTRKMRKMSGTEVAAKLDISPQYYYDIERGKRGLSAEIALKLSKIFKVPMEFLMGQDLPEDSRLLTDDMYADGYTDESYIEWLEDRVARYSPSKNREEPSPDNLRKTEAPNIPIPILGTIACGNPIYAKENFSGYRYESPDNLPSGSLYYLEAKGDSMEPTIPNGSYVLIREQPEVEYGEIAAVLVNGDTEATLKRIKKQGEFTMLVPDNRSYNPIIVDEKNPVRIIGKAIRYTRDL